MNDVYLLPPTYLLVCYACACEAYPIGVTVCYALPYPYFMLPPLCNPHSLPYPAQTSYPNGVPGRSPAMGVRGLHRGIMLRYPTRHNPPTTKGGITPMGVRGLHRGIMLRMRRVVKPFMLRIMGMLRWTKPYSTLLMLPEVVPCIIPLWGLGGRVEVVKGPHRGKGVGSIRWYG